MSASSKRFRFTPRLSGTPNANACCTRCVDAAHRRTSSAPGKTRTINFFRVNGKLGFVDLPGYGFAQVSRGERAAWGPMVEQFFRVRRELRGVVHLVDARHQPTVEDQRTRSW